MLSRSGLTLIQYEVAWGEGDRTDYTIVTLSGWARNAAKLGAKKTQARAISPGPHAEGEEDPCRAVQLVTARTS